MLVWKNDWKMNSQANLINFQPNLKFEKNSPVVFVIVFFCFVLFCFFLVKKKFTIFIIIISWVYSPSLIHGVGEVDIRDKDEKEDRDNSFDEEQLSVPEVESLPYLLLDVRDEDAYKQCHIIGGVYS